MNGIAMVNIMPGVPSAEIKRIISVAPGHLYDLTHYCNCFLSEYSDAGFAHK